MRQYIKYWYVILAGALLGVLGAYLYLRYVAVPKYSITTSILIRKEESAPTLAGLTNTTAEDLLKPSQNIDNEMQILRSRSLMLRVVDELALYAAYYAPGSERKTELYGTTLPVTVAPFSALTAASYGQAVQVTLRPDSSCTVVAAGQPLGTYRLGQPIACAYGTFSLLPTPHFGELVRATPGVEVVFSNPQLVAEGYNQQLTVASVNKDANVLNLSLISVVPEQGKDVVNKLIEVYNKEAVEDKNQASSNKLSFLDDRIKSLSSELSGVEQNVEQYKQAHEIANVSAQTSSYIEQADTYQRKLAEWATQIEVLESIERYLGRTDNPHQLVPSTLGIQDPTLLELLTKFNGLQQERERMLRTTQEGNPLVQNLNEQIAGLRTSALENLRNIKRGLVITSRNLRATSGQFRAKISDAPVVERQLQAKGRQQSLKQNIYLYLLQKREEAALALAATTSNSRIIDAAVVSNKPISPNHNMTYLLGLLVGIGLPLSGLYAKTRLNTRVEDRSTVEALTTTPILGEIARNKGNTVVATANMRSAQAEMFGLVRANLNFATAGGANKVVLVTSVTSGEGKSFVSINLSNSLALTGKRVLLLDLDLRRPALAGALRLRPEPGLTDYLVSPQLSIADIIQIPAEAPNLFVISAGAVPPNPAELLQSAKLTFLLDELKKSFDYILIDTPPIGLVADALSLSALADSTVCVARYRYTTREQVQRIEALYRSRQFRNMMLVLNDSPHTVSNYYGQTPSPVVRKKTLEA